MATDELIHISWSSLSNFEHCRQKYSLYSKHLQSPTMDTRNFLAGSVCDKIMRDFLKDPQPNTMVGMVDQYMAEHIQDDVDNERGVVHWKNNGDQNAIKAKCRKALTNLEPILYQLVIPYDYEGAKRFKVPIELPDNQGESKELLLVGETDITIRDPDGRRQVWDLKVTSSPSYYKKVIGQLLFYDIVMRLQYGKTCSRLGLIQPLLPQAILDFTFGEDEYRQMWARIHRFALGIWSGSDEPKKNNDGCAYCPVFHACAKFNKKTIDGRYNIQGGV